MSRSLKHQNNPTNEASSFIVSGARQDAKQTLLDHHLIGVMIDPNKQYWCHQQDDQDVHRIRAEDLKQNFAYVDGQFFHGRAIFRSCKAYEELQESTEPGDLSTYFKKDFLQNFPVKDLSKLEAACHQITLNPYSKEALEAEEHIATIAANNIHPRKIRKLQQTNNFIIAAEIDEAGNLAEPFKHSGERVVGYYCSDKKLVLIANHKLDPDKVGHTLAHEVGHMIDYAGTQQSQFSHGWSASDSEIYRQMVHHTLEHIEHMLRSMGGCEANQDVPRLTKAIKRLENKPTRNGKVLSESGILESAHTDLMRTLPPEERYTLDHECKRCYRNVFEAYDSRESQIIEIPAVVARITDVYSMQIARIVMPELYRAAMDVNATNPLFYRNDDQLQNVKQLASSPDRNKKKEATKAAWLERIDLAKDSSNHIRDIF